MKNIILVILLFFTIQTVTFAEILSHKVYAVTQQEISQKKIKAGDTISLISIDEYEVSDIERVEKNQEVKIKITEYVKPKRGKRNGYYKIKYLSNNNEEIRGTLKPSTPKDLKEIAEKAGITAVGHILNVPGFSQIVAVSKGVIKPNENQSRLESAGKNLYESTPLTYVEEGKDIFIDTDGIVVLKLKKIEEE